MWIEERIKRLEEAVENLAMRIDMVQNEKWVTPSELAKIMNCSINNIYIKIRSGEIYATDKLGSIKRIPMSQFYKNELLKEEKLVDEKPRTQGRAKKTAEEIRKKVFGY